MASIGFSRNIQSHVDLDRMDVSDATIRGALESVFAEHPKLRSYLLDDRGAVRKHVAIFVNGASIQDRETLSDSLAETDEVFVMQALSGG